MVSVRRDATQHNTAAMGRMNNKRTQAAAQAAKNTPSRARFSKGPPNKGGRGRGSGRKEREPPPKPKSRGIGGGSGGGGRGRNRGNPQTTARVIDKIQNRVGGSDTKQAQPSVSASTGNSSIDIALKNLDKSKLDVVAVSKETQNLIADLLRELGVVGNDIGGGSNTIHKMANSNKNKNNDTTSSNNANNGDDDNSFPTTAKGTGKHRKELETFITNNNDDNNNDSVIWVIQKHDQNSGKETSGRRIQKILSNTDYHPRGIKVLLEDGIVGRVSRIEGGEKSKTKTQQRKNTTTTTKGRVMNPNANEYEYRDNSLFPTNGEPMQRSSLVSTDSNGEFDESGDGDDSSVDSDQRMYDFLMEQSDARNTDTAILEEEDGYFDGDEKDEMQKRMAANRRKKQREDSTQNQKEEEAIHDNTSSAVEEGGPSPPVVSDNEGEKEKIKNSADTTDNFENDRTFLHLTQTLSFSHSQASKACRAIECWDTQINPQEEITSDTDNKNSDSRDPRDSKIMDFNNNNNDDDNRIELAMDWLCLHLSDKEVNRGFLPNPKASKVSQVASIRKLGSNTNNTKIKAVAHPSISIISKPIEEQAKEWAKAVELQERTLKLMRLGFHRGDAIKAFDDLPDSEDSSSAAAIDDPALPLLLSRLQDTKGTESRETTSTASNEIEDILLENAREEREQELEALRAIYDDRLQVVYRSKDGSIVKKVAGNDSESDSNDWIPERYILQIEPATPLGEPAKADECSLHVILRDKYPAAQTPLLLLVTKPVLPPSLCRKILSELGKQAQEILGISNGAETGYPVVFELVAYLEENLPSFHKEFCNEQRRKEFEAEQARLLRQRQIEMEKSEKAMELVYKKASRSESGVGVESLGRRQKAKLKAAEKAFDRPDQKQALYKEYRRKQEERVKATQHQNKSANVRATKAQQAILNRQKELIDEEAEKAARSAMSEAFRKGKSREEAREAAEKARIESYRENGVTIVDENAKEEVVRETESPEETKGKGDESNSKDSTQSPRPTKASSKFMERLRNTSSQPSTVTIDASTNITVEAKKKPIKGPTPNTSAFMDRLREMYESAANNGKNSKGEKDDGGSNKGSMNSKLDGYHLYEPSEEDEEEDSIENLIGEPSSIKRPNPVAVPSGELAEIMTDIITQQKSQPWLVSSEARAPTTHSSERKRVSPTQFKREKEISERLKNELSRKRRMATEWAETNNGDCDTAKNNASNTKSKKNNGKGRKKEDTSFTPERFHNMMTMRQR